MAPFIESTNEGAIAMAPKEEAMPITENKRTRQGRGSMRCLLLYNYI